MNILEKIEKVLSEEPTIINKPKKVKEVLGWLKFADGTELNLTGDEGELDKIRANKHKRLVSFGKKEFDDDANLYITYTNRSHESLNNLNDIKRFIKSI